MIWCVYVMLMMMIWCDDEENSKNAFGNQSQDFLITSQTRWPLEKDKLFPIQLSKDEL